MTSDKILYSLIGPPCVGKGTQSHLLEKKDAFKMIGAGELLRKAAEHNTECAQLVTSGQLVPAEMIWGLIEHEIIKYQASHKLVLDGYPRQLEQIQFLHQYITRYNLQLIIINMQASNQNLMSRMKRRVFCTICNATEICTDNNICCNHKMIRRNDDNLEAFALRLDTFNENITDIRQFAASHSIYTWYDISAENDTVQEIHNKIVRLFDIDRVL